eukprot:TRINITY_DN51837_c0_g1_i1.p1 TRINITY_DN51837_c0_g1~~TRINITY_DN51837_c0_g1_i1.p1  ORF type:complete len:181 (-),score=28.91 TRINITY_DN51837_c0_g1_i1:192-734(-)
MPIRSFSGAPLLVLFVHVTTGGRIDAMLSIVGDDAVTKQPSSASTDFSTAEFMDGPSVLQVGEDDANAGRPSSLRQSEDDDTSGRMELEEQDGFDGDFEGDFTGDFVGDFAGDFEGDIEGHLHGDLDGHIVRSDTEGGVPKDWTGEFRGEFHGDLWGHFHGRFKSGGHDSHHHSHQLHHV